MGRGNLHKKKLFISLHNVILLAPLKCATAKIFEKNLKELL